MQQTLRVAVSALVLVWSLAAQAQTLDQQPALSELAVGADVRAELDEQSQLSQGSDPVIYQDYLIRLDAGQRVQIDLSAGDFDPYLELYRAGQTGGDPLVFNDDGSGGGTDARLRYTADAGGRYVLRARTFSGTGGGHYRLTIQNPPEIAYPAAEPVAVGDSRDGRLTKDDARDEDEIQFDLYQWLAEPGERLRILLASDDFDPRVSVGQMTNGHFVELASNDDGPGQGLNSELIFSSSEVGAYLIKVMAVADVGEGRYSLTTEPGPLPPRVRDLRPDDTVQGRLDAQTGKSDSGVAADHYRFVGRAGQRVSVTMKSSDFDAFVELFDAGMNSVASDDDGAGHLNARLVHRLTADGEYRIEARSVEGAEGDYDLTLTLLPEPPVPSAIDFGQTLEGELKSGQAVDDDGLPYASYAFSGRKNQRVQVTVRSGDFDAMAQIGRMGDDDAFEVLASDDDGLRQGTDARLNLTLPEDGEYLARALSYEADSEGLYSIELTNRGPEPGPGSLLVPSVARGSLSDLDGLTAEGIAYDAYSFRAKANDRLRFTLIAATFDALVEVGEDKNGNWRVLASDDDGLSDTHARLDWTAPRDGIYLVRARSFSQGATGDYVLIVEKQP
ncbi:PPC domain-containing protein [Brevundimonas vesicularis]|uniref:PPC domain-containing protein n=1 Tax=Brevundimonas vesicularis TaxID=41276 RepID=UPI0038D3970B